MLNKFALFEVASGEIKDKDKVGGENEAKGNQKGPDTVKPGEVPSLNQASDKNMSTQQ